VPLTLLSSVFGRVALRPGSSAGFRTGDRVANALDGCICFLSGVFGSEEGFGLCFVPGWAIFKANAYLE